MIFGVGGVVPGGGVPAGGDGLAGELERDGPLVVALVAAVAGTMAAGGLSRGCRAAQAARRRTSQTVAAMSRTDSASSQPPSIHWNGQNRLPGW